MRGCVTIIIYCYRWLCWVDWVAVWMVSRCLLWTRKGRREIGRPRVSGRHAARSSARAGCPGRGVMVIQCRSAVPFRRPLKVSRDGSKHRPPLNYSASEYVCIHRLYQCSMHTFGVELDPYHHGAEPMTPSSHHTYPAHRGGARGRSAGVPYRRSIRPACYPLSKRRARPSPFHACRPGDMLHSSWLVRQPGLGVSCFPRIAIKDTGMNRASVLSRRRDILTATRRLFAFSPPGLRSR